MHSATLCFKFSLSNALGFEIKDSQLEKFDPFSDAGDFTSAHNVFHHNPDGVVQIVIDLQFLLNLVELLLTS